MADIEGVRSEIFVRTNQIRSDHSLGSLAVDDKLSLAAQLHAVSMATDSNFDFSQPTRRTR